MGGDEPRQPEERAGNVALIGFMGAGKSAVGPLLAAKLGMDFVDLDGVVSSRASMSVEEIFAREGEEGFRARESGALKAVLGAGSRVISCGGGIVLRDENIELLRRASRVYFLEISWGEVLKRLSGAGKRPLLAGDDLEGTVRGLLAERYERYLRAAHEVIDAEGDMPEEIAEEIAERWRRYRSGPREENIRSS